MYFLKTYKLRLFHSSVDCWWTSIVSNRYCLDRIVRGGTLCIFLWFDDQLLFSDTKQLILVFLLYPGLDASMMQGYS